MPKHGAPKFWTERAIVLALQLWAELYGSPPRMLDWRTQRRGAFPWDTTVVDTFGTWNAAVEAAGLEPNKPGRKPE